MNANQEEKCTRCRRRLKVDEIMDKIAMLTQILAQNRADAFLGLAMEHANQGQTDAALRELDQLLSTHPDYTAGYFMAAQTLAKAGRRG